MPPAVAGLVLLALIAALLVYPSEYVYRVLVWQESDAFDWQKFPPRPQKLERSPRRGSSPAPRYCYGRQAAPSLQLLRGTPPLRLMGGDRKRSP
jgi:hypothetical protein